MGAETQSQHRRRRVVTLALPLLLAACAGAVDRPPGAASTAGAASAGGSAAAAPAGAILYRDTITVHYADGALCAASRPGGAREWQGRLAGCPYTRPYQARLPQAPQPPRVVLAPAPAAQAVIALSGGRAFGLPAAR